MKSGSISVPKITKHMLVLALTLVAITFLTPRVYGQTFEVFYSFTGGSDGGNPLAGLVIDKDGNLYGTNSDGGSPYCVPAYCGTVFKIDPNGNETTLHAFAGGTDGAAPESQLLLDGNGNLFGTTYNGGGSANCPDGCGSVFEIAANGTETVLYGFHGGTDGENPVAGLAMDKEGNLYGTTFNGGAYGYGAVFEVNASGQENVLYSFTGGKDGANPIAGVTFDKGTLLGTTSLGGDMTCLNPNNTYGCGVLFQLGPISSTAKGPATTWSETVLHTFEMQTDGGVPYAGLIVGHSGAIYGATTSGGSGLGGTVFELKPAKLGWIFDPIYGISGWALSGTYRDLVQDASGNIYATTHCDGVSSNGTAYELSPSGSNWTYTLLYTFCQQSPCYDGYYPHSNIVIDAQGNLYGTTFAGGANLYDGEVFRITP